MAWIGVPRVERFDWLVPSAATGLTFKLTPSIDGLKTHIAPFTAHSSLTNQVAFAGSLNRYLPQVPTWQLGNHTTVFCEPVIIPVKIPTSHIIGTRTHGCAKAKELTPGESSPPSHPVKYVSHE